MRAAPTPSSRGLVATRSRDPEKPAPSSAYSRPQTAQQAVLAELRALIVRGELPPGSPIVQDALAEQFGVSRVPVREALKILEGEGHVVYTAHRGYSVLKLEVSDLLEVYRLRTLLESEVAAESVSRMTDDHLAQMQRAMDGMDAAADEQDIVRVGIENRLFHFAVFAPSTMNRTTKLIRQLWDTTDPYRSLYFVKPLNRETVNSEHVEIFHACEQRDAPRVVRLLDVHRSHAVEDLQALGGEWT